MEHITQKSNEVTPEMIRNSISAVNHQVGRCPIAKGERFGQLQNMYVSIYYYYY